MKSIEELERKVWEEISIATKERDADKLASLNPIVLNIAKIKKDIERINHQLNNNGQDIISIKTSTTKSSYGSGSLYFPPSGTACRFNYRGEEFNGFIENGKLNINQFGTFDSFSGASVEITKTSRNGWRDWEIRLPGAQEWVLADIWRRGRK